MVPPDGSLREAPRARFFIYVQDYDANDPKTHKGHNLDVVTSRQLFSSFGLEASTIDFVGHAVALATDDSYLDRPARKMVMAVKLYNESLLADRAPRTSTPSTASASSPRVSPASPRCTVARTCSTSPT